MGRKARDFLSSATSYHMVCLCETHLVGHTEAARFLRKHHWKSSWAPARVNGPKGTSGGVCIASRADAPVFHTAHTVEGPISSVPGHANVEMSDWCYAVWHTQTLSFVMVMMYLDCSIGATGVSNHKLQTLALFLHRLRLPALVAADWNMSPSTLIDSGWPARLKLRVMVPSDSEVTCYAGAGTLGDYLLVSDVLRPHVKVTLDPASPWPLMLGFTYRSRQSQWT